MELCMEKQCRTVLQTANNVNGSNTLSNLAAGTYTVTVTDDAGCTASNPLQSHLLPR